jgi:hypothetical protein
VLYLATTWPGMVGATTAFVQYKLFTDEGCDQFIGSVRLSSSVVVVVVCRRRLVS